FYSQGSQLIAKDLRPEITNGFEGGVDFRLLGDRIDGSFTYYKTSSTNQVVSAGVSGSTGFTGYLLNAGELTNKGVEAVLRFTPIRKNEWSLSVGGNYTYNENELVALTSDLNRIAINGSSAIYGVVGQAFPVIIGTDYNRDPQGRVIVDRITGNPSVSSESRILGNTVPKHRLGLDMSVNYKGFRLTNVFEYRGGYFMYNTGNFDFSGSSGRSAYYNRERFVFPNSSFLDPATNEYVENRSVLISDGGAGFWTSNSYNMNVASNYLFSGNYWKWREVSLTYTVPAKALKNIKFIKSALIGFQGRNLFLFAPKSNEFTDPDYSANGDNNAVGVSN
ncbi:MAG: TonB-dependent receptor, partial [Pedobacter sp.]